MRKNKIAIILQRTVITYDVIMFLKSLKLYYEISIIVKDNDFKYFQDKLTGFDIIKYTIAKKKWNRLLSLLFTYFGFLPKSINNYKVVSFFAHSKISSKTKRVLTSIKFRIELLLPKFYSYNRYLSDLKPCVTVKSFDTVLFFTHIGDDELLSHYIKSFAKIYIYLYSWDHSCKLKRLPGGTHYFVWNEQIKEDLILLNRLNNSAVSIVGSTQLAAVVYYLNIKPRQDRTPKKSKYILFAFSTGYKELIEDEINFIIYLNNLIEKLNCDIGLKVRAYPMNQNANAYDSLRRSNISFIDTSGNSLIEWNSISKKYDQIYEASALFHFGTTLGLEASFFTTPVFLIDFYNYAKNISSPLSLEKFVHQYQNDKYLNVAHSLNVIRSPIQLEKILKHIDKGIVEPYENYSLKIQEQFQLRSMDEIAADVYKIIQ